MVVTIKIACRQFCLLALLLVLLPSVAATEKMYPATNYINLVADNKASKLGDLLTVVILESSEARTEADSRVNRDFVLGGGFETGRGSFEEGSVEVGLGRDRVANTQRKGSFRAALSVAVIDIDASGNLLVAGQQTINVDGKKQHIGVRGVVRPIDISEDNSVLSTRLLNADIHYSGRAGGQGSKKKNIFMRSLNAVGLFRRN